MKNNFLFIAILVFLFSGCDNSNNQDSHEEPHDHEAQEEFKNQYTSYHADYELFAEADVFTVGESANLLSHFTRLPSFKALKNASITLRLLVNKTLVSQTLENPTRDGIYSFYIKPLKAGKGELFYDIKDESGTSTLHVSDIIVYENKHAAIHGIKITTPPSNTVVFTKEQSWKTGFATKLPEIKSFGQVIKATAQVKTSQNDEQLFIASTNGRVTFALDNTINGKNVSNGDLLFTVSSKDFAYNNSEVIYAEAKNDFEINKENFERLQTLSKDKIVSNKELLEAKSSYLNAKLVYDHLIENFSINGQVGISTTNGIIKEVLVENGQYVEQGQALMRLSQNKSLLLCVEVQQKYAPILNHLNTANISSPYGDKRLYSLEELKGSILSTKNSISLENHLIPVYLQIENTIGLISGSFVDVYLKEKKTSESITVPLTALLEEQGYFFVFVQITPELFQKREVKIGATDGIDTEIVEGLHATERVVSQGAILIKLAQSTGNLDAHSGHVH